MYDTVGDLGWRVSVSTHRILSVISDVLERYDGVPVCGGDVDCVDCFGWKFFEGGGGNYTVSSTTTTAITTTTTTESSTTTCMTPGWWRCRDSTTTTDKQETAHIAMAVNLLVNHD